MLFGDKKINSKTRDEMHKHRRKIIKQNIVIINLNNFFLYKLKNEFQSIQINSLF